MFPEYAGSRFPYWFRSSWEGIRRIWDSIDDVVLYVEIETGEILIWRYRSLGEGGTVGRSFCTRPNSHQ